MKCDLCKKDPAVKGRLLCPPCKEAIVRLARLTDYRPSTAKHFDCGSAECCAILSCSTCPNFATT